MIKSSQTVCVNGSQARIADFDPETITLTFFLLEPAFEKEHNCAKSNYFNSVIVKDQFFYGILKYEIKLTKDKPSH